MRNEWYLSYCEHRTLASECLANKTLRDKNSVVFAAAAEREKSIEQIESSETSNWKKRERQEQHVRLIYWAGYFRRQSQQLRMPVRFRFWCYRLCCNFSGWVGFGG